MSHILLNLVVGLASISVAMAAETKPQTSEGKSSGSNSNHTPGVDDNAWQSLSLRQKIGQTMLMLPNRKAELELGGGSLKGFFERYPVTGFFLGWKLFDGIKESDHLAHVLKSVAEYQGASGLPLIFQEDYDE